MIDTEKKTAETKPTEVTRDEAGEKSRRRSFSLRALLPGPYVRYPK
ncbi:hypothetical protein ACFFQF_25090 [Haladaptatus pallidirubidus]|nr:hypothetical protein [Haladaptatus pallidirubidus]